MLLANDAHGRMVRKRIPPPQKFPPRSRGAHCKGCKDSFVSLSFGSAPCFHSPMECPARAQTFTAGSSGVFCRSRIVCTRAPTDSRPSKIPVKDRACSLPLHLPRRDGCIFSASPCVFVRSFVCPFDVSHFTQTGTHGKHISVRLTTASYFSPHPRSAGLAGWMIHTRHMFACAAAIGSLSSRVLAVHFGGIFFPVEILFPQPPAFGSYR